MDSNPAFGHTKDQGVGFLFHCLLNWLLKLGRNSNAKKNTIWKTAIWFDTKKNTYILPLKAEIRNKEQIAEGDKVNCYIWL